MTELKPILSTGIEQVMEGVLIADEMGNIHCANDAALVLLNLSGKTKPHKLSEIGAFDLAELISAAINNNENADEESNFSGNFSAFDHELKGEDGVRHLRFRTGLCNVPGSTDRFRAVMIQDRTEERRLDAILNFSRSGEMITNDSTMQEILSQAIHVAKTEASVMIQGESGTGKTLLARMIHKNSPRNLAPFVEVSCAAIPDALVESELFGHVKGAFTSAISDRQGRFQAANNGTLFLDEVGEIPLNLQPKLLKALQDQEFEKVGSDETTSVDVRIISASNKELRAAVDDGLFRSDLYYRLAVIPIHIPPLRERPGDVPLLIKHFYKGLAERGHSKDIGFSHKAIMKMMDYPWPGNVRELANAVEHGIICAQGNVVTEGSLPREIREFGKEQKSKPSHSPSHEEEEDRNHILSVLNKAKGNRAVAAEKLGIDRSTLWRKMKRLGIKPKELEPGEGEKII